MGENRGLDDTKGVPPTLKPPLLSQIPLRFQPLGALQRLLNTHISRALGEALTLIPDARLPLSPPPGPWWSRLGTAVQG